VRIRKRFYNKFFTSNERWKLKSWGRGNSLTTPKHVICHYYDAFNKNWCQFEVIISHRLGKETCSSPCRMAAQFNENLQWTKTVNVKTMPVKLFFIKQYMPKKIYLVFIILVVYYNCFRIGFNMWNSANWE